MNYKPLRHSADVNTKRPRCMVTTARSEELLTVLVRQEGVKTLPLWIYTSVSSLYSFPLPFYWNHISWLCCLDLNPVLFCALHVLSSSLFALEIPHPAFTMIMFTLGPLSLSFCPSFLPLSLHPSFPAPLLCSHDIVWKLGYTFSRPNTNTHFTASQMWNLSSAGTHCEHGGPARAQRNVINKILLVFRQADPLRKQQNLNCSTYCCDKNASRHSSRCKPRDVRRNYPFVKWTSCIRGDLNRGYLT